MAERAQVTSVEAIEAFRSQLILYLSKARPTLEEVSSDVLRTRMWLQNDQRRHWEKEFKIRSKKLERAQGELFGARISTLQDVDAAKQMAVRRAREAVEEAQSKLSALKKWDRELENRSEPYVKQVNQLHDFMTTSMSKAVVHLAEIIKSLEAYADVLRPGSSAAPSTSRANESAPESGTDGGTPKGESA
jgi:hypothetical protein